jgi:hypothetical protein
LGKTGSEGEHKMMKYTLKLVSIVFISFLLFSLSGCSGNDNNKTNVNENSLNKASNEESKRIDENNGKVSSNTQSGTKGESIKRKSSIPPTITITIIGPEQYGAILPETSIEITEGETVLDVLDRVAKSQQIVIDYSGKGAFAYVEGINHVYEFDYGPKSGWTVMINDSVLEKSSGITQVNDGDYIEWLYTDEYVE